MKKEQLKLDVVVVAACMSRGIGEVFQRCGVNHVICVEQNRELLDTAAIAFTKSFYSELFAGRSVCAAFDKAKSSVSF